MGKIIVEQLQQTAVEDLEVELVERKGKGHPDSICDAIANSASVALCELYQKTCGRILHHNLDKMTLIAGRTRPQIGGGTVDAPMKLVLGDRATTNVGGQQIDLESAVFQAAIEWLRTNLRFVDPALHMVFQNEIKAGSVQLASLFDRKCVAANDSSVAVGFAPFTATERAVLLIEKHMNSLQFKEMFPETGEDIKVMAFRQKRSLHLTIAVAFVDRFVPDRQTYFKRKAEITDYLAAYAHSAWAEFDNVKIDVNTLDDPRAEEGMYLTVLGTSAEGSDSGQVGRGNRANGLISFNRPQSIEAHAGKNPIHHVGKIYSYLATHIARQILLRTKGIREVYVYLCSQIGRPIDDPLVSSLKLVLGKGAPLDHVKREVQDILSQELANIPGFTGLLATEGFYRNWEENIF